MSNEIVTVNITRETTTVSAKGFGVPLIFSDEATFADVRSYTSITGVADDFGSTTDTYLLANAMFSQELVPEKIQVAKWDTANALTDELNDLVVKPNGNDFYFLFITSVVEADVLDAAAWTESNKKLFLTQSVDPDVLESTTADIAGQLSALNYDRTAGIYTSAGTSQVQTIVFDADFVASNSIAGTINDIAITPVVFTTDNDTTLAALATEIQSNADVLTAVASGTAPNQHTITITSVLTNPITTVTLADFVVTLGASNPVATITETIAGRSSTMGNLLHAAWGGLQAPKKPGSTTWKFKNLSGQASDIMSSTAVTNTESKNWNTYREIGGVAITTQGVVVSGEFIDIMRGTDKIEAGITESVYQTLVSAEKVPFTDAGVNQLVNKVTAELNEAVTDGILKADPAPIVKTVPVSEVSTADKGTRTYNDITFSAEYAGAIHKTKIVGKIS